MANKKDSSSIVSGFQTAVSNALQGAIDGFHKVHAQALGGKPATPQRVMFEDGSWGTPYPDAKSNSKDPGMMSKIMNGVSNTIPFSRPVMEAAQSAMYNGYLPNSEGLGVQPQSRYQYYPKANQYLDYYFRPSPVASDMVPEEQRFGVPMSVGTGRGVQAPPSFSYTMAGKGMGGQPQEVLENMDWSQYPPGQYAPYGYTLNQPMQPARFGDAEMALRSFLAQRGVTF